MSVSWHLHPADPVKAEGLARVAGVDPLTAQLLLNRGVRSVEDARRFFSPSLASLEPPAAVPDLLAGVDRIKRAIVRQEAILIFGDSDVDGVSASVILFEVLQECGAVVRVKLSNRILDGYGVPDALVRHVCRSSTQLVILVDCGTNQPDVVQQLAACRIDTIVIDHHVPITGWARPCALVNPHRDRAARMRELSSAGLAFKMAQALLHGADDERLIAYLDIAALGMLADCCPLVRESRTIIAEGLKRIIGSRRGGLRRLCEVTGTLRAEPDTIIRRLIPRLNASGRLGDAAAVLHLLLAREQGNREEWLKANEAAHTTTKQLHRRLLGEATEQVGRVNFRDEYVLVVSRSGWHQGMMGPLASQLAQRYGRPAIAIAMDAHSGTGSGRSIPAFNLLDALQACQGLLTRFGGHAQACGLTVDRGRLEAFRALVNEHARLSLGRQGLVKTRMVDLELPLAGLRAEWVRETSRLAPFGIGNERPTILVRRLSIEQRSPRKAILSDGSTGLLGRGQFAADVSGGRYDVVASPGMDGDDVVLTVSDVKLSAAP